MDFENKEKEFEPSWGVLIAYFTNGGFAQTICSLKQYDFNIKPEITSLIINQTLDRLKTTFKYNNIIILNIQIIWINEPLK
jgi:hypothetical protein